MSEKTIVYLAPSTWAIPELGLLVEDQYSISDVDELLRPTHHGNDLNFDPRYWRLLFTSAEGSPLTLDQNLLINTTRITPLFQAILEDGVVVAVNDSPHLSRWEGIPVPIY